MMKKTPNHLLRHAREERGWSQMRLAEELGVEEQTVRHWERGTRFPYPISRNRLCEIFGMSLEQLGLQRSLNASQQTDIPHNPSLSAIIDQDVSISLHPVDRNRMSLLKRVRSTWIEGVLEHSLQHAPLLVLGLQEQPDALLNPWRSQFQQIDEASETLPMGIRILQVYDNANGELLILGEPGAGKTTLLLELTRELLERATSDDTHPIPIVLNLSSWVQKRFPLPIWIAQELYEKYGIPQGLSQRWVEEERILPLLDGLDEVADTSLAVCIDAINTYRKDHGFVPMVVCGRRAEYLSQQARLLLSTAVVIQPLTQSQIDNYILNAGEDLALLRHTLENDPVLFELASSPLLLSILVLLARNHSQWETLLMEGSLIERRRLVLQQYVERVLQRRSKSRYTAEETKRWLVWLAQQMQQRSQTEFYVERLQPDWLPDRSRRSYYLFVTRFLNGFGHVIVYMIFALLVGGSGHGGDAPQNGILGLLGGPPGDAILGWMGGGIVGGFNGGASLGLIFALVVALCSFVIRFASRTEWSWYEVWKRLFRGLFRGLPLGLLIAVFTGTLVGILQRSVAIGISTGLGYGLLGSLTYGLIYGFAYLAKDNHLSDEIRVRRGGGIRVRLGDALVIGICSWAGFAIVDIFEAGWYYALVYGFTVSLGISLVFVFNDRFATSFGDGLAAEIKPSERLAWSWTQFRIHVRYDAVRGLMIGLSMAFIVMIMIGLSSGISHRNVMYGATYGLVDGFIIGLILAGMVTLTLWLYHGWSSSLVEEHDFFQPNEGIHRSLRYSFFSALVLGSSMGIFSGIIISFAFGVIGQLSTWLIIGAGFTIIFTLIFMNLFGFVYGGVAVMAHIILRVYLYRQTVMPLNYVAFLNDAAERILLRKIGGGYMFVHSQLRDYFALLDKDEVKNGNSESQS